MTDDAPGKVTLRDVYDVVERLERKIDLRLAATDGKIGLVDGKVDGLASRIDRIEGAVGLVKWLGPAGVAAVVIALYSLAGGIPK